MNKIDNVELQKFLMSCNYTNEQRKLIRETIDNNLYSLCILRQIYAALNKLNFNENEYMQVFNYLVNHYNLGCNILEIGGGHYPVLSKYIDDYQRKIKCGTVTVIDPDLAVKKLGNVKLVKDGFNLGDDISKYDLIISMAPCFKIDEIAVAAIKNKKEFLITMCNCIIERYPELVDYYFDDDYDPLLDRLLYEMRRYNEFLKNDKFFIDSGSIFYENYREIKYFTGKKLIK